MPVVWAVWIYLLLNSDIELRYEAPQSNASLIIDYPNKWTDGAVFCCVYISDQIAKVNERIGYL